MHQFDVCRLKERSDQLVVVLQHDMCEDLDTRIVAPVSSEPCRKVIGGIRLPIELEGNHYVVQLDRLAAVERRSIGNVVGKLATDEQRIKNALDLLFFGV